MGTYRHDAERLRSLAGAFDNVKNKFGSMSSSGDAARSIFGTGEVGDAYDTFLTGWSHKREDLGKQMDTAAQSLRDMAQRYDDLERDLSTACTPEGGRP